MTAAHRDEAGSVAVVVATRGRGSEVSVLLDLLAQSSRQPDRVVIVGSEPADWGRARESGLSPVTLIAPQPGLPRQRNEGVSHLLADVEKRPDIIVFFDDDFRPEPHWLEAAMAVFAAHPDVVGLTGVVLRDGAQTAAIAEQEAKATIAAWLPPAGVPTALVPRLYGCNMAVRTAVFDQVRFDDRLPLYGWLEDLDFSGQLPGRLVTAQACGGVHLGSKGARVSGYRYGYSQIVNPLYLARKGTCPRGLAVRLVVQALASNSLRSTRQHRIFEYRGRLGGNLRAVVDLARGRAAPERIYDL